MAGGEEVAVISEVAVILEEDAATSEEVVVISVEVVVISEEVSEEVVAILKVDEVSLTDRCLRESK